MAVSYGKGSRGVATKLHSKITRSIGYCERCGNQDYSKLTCAHIIGRKYSATRTRLTNALCLCYACHRFFTDHPREFSRYITTTWAQEFYQTNYELAIVNRKYTTTYWDSEKERLKSILAQIDRGVPLSEIRKDEKHTLDI